MRVKHWQKIGIMASIGWVVGGGFWINYRMIERASYAAWEEHLRCLGAVSIQSGGTMPKDTDRETCDQKYEKDSVASVADHWYATAIYTLVPVPIAWLFVYGLIALARWIKSRTLGNARHP
jgi:hypothetical protein